MIRDLGWPLALLIPAIAFVWGAIASLVVNGYVGGLLSAATLAVALSLLAFAAFRRGGNSAWAEAGRRAELEQAHAETPE